MLPAYRAVTDMLNGQGQLMHPELVLPVFDVVLGRIGGVFRHLCPNRPSLAVRLGSIRKQPLDQDSGLPNAHLFLTILAARLLMFCYEHESLFSLPAPAESKPGERHAEVWMQLISRIDIRRYSTICAKRLGEHDSAAQPDRRLITIFTFDAIRWLQAEL